METIVHMQDGKYLGQTRFAPNLLKESLALAVAAVRGVASVLSMKISRSKDSNNLVVDVDLVVLNTDAVPEVAYRVQEEVISVAAQLTDHKIDHVNIYVRGAKYGTNPKQK